MQREFQIGALDRSSLVTIEELMRLCSEVLGAGSRRQLYRAIIDLMREADAGQCFRDFRICTPRGYWGVQTCGRPRLHLHFQNRYSGFEYIDGFNPSYGYTVRFQLGLVVRELINNGGIGVHRFPERITFTNDWYAQNALEEDDAIRHNDIHHWEELLVPDTPPIPAFPPTPPPSSASSSSTTVVLETSDDDSLSDISTVCLCYRCANCLNHVAEEAGGRGDDGAANGGTNGN